MIELMELCIAAVGIGAVVALISFSRDERDMDRARFTSTCCLCGHKWEVTGEDLKPNVCDRCEI
jgi:hypothetical protein